MRTDWLRPLLAVLAAALAAASPARAATQIPAETGDREIAIVLDAAASAHRIAGEPAAIRLLLAAEPNLASLGPDTAGTWRVLVPASESHRLAQIQDRARRLGAMATRAMPTKAVRDEQWRRVLFSRAGKPDVAGLMVTYRTPTLKSQSADGVRLEAETLARVEGVIEAKIAAHRPMSGGAYALRLEQPTDLATGELLAARLRMDPQVERVTLDTFEQAMLTPNDEGASLQWNLFDAVSGIRADRAWDITTGSSSTVVAVVDSGILGHPEFSDRIVAGADMISSATTSNDGDGRDGSAVDAGTFGPTNLCPPGLSESTWHGTFVAGIIGATGNNGTGIAGVNWRTRILPVRVLGRCGSGTSSDILDGLRWSVGIAVPGLPVNPNPARVVNMSLAGTGQCSSRDDYQLAIVEALLRRATVVVAAGNEGEDALNRVPASCVGAITVSAVGSTGDKASYSNFSPAIEIAAPGGNMANGGRGIWSTSATGTLGDPISATYKQEQGTSHAAPHVAGVVSLMLAVNPNLTVAQVRDFIQAFSSPFPAGSSCERLGDCGRGIVNAFESVQAARDYNQAYNLSAMWWTPSESGWGLNLQQQGNTIFGTWFTYGSDGSPQWFVIPEMKRISEDYFSGDIYTTTGVPMTQIAGSAAIRTVTKVGTAVVGFLSLGSGLFIYDVNGVSGAKELEVELYAKRPACIFSTGSRAGLVNYQDIWWNASENGWGINLVHQGDTIFATWFTYSATGAPIWYVGPEIKKTGPGAYSGTLYSTTGIPFNLINGSQSLSTATIAGTIAFAFQDGETAQMTYVVNGVAGAKAIRRQVFSSPLSYCLP